MLLFHSSAIFAICTALLLDLIIGDPVWFYHPVRAVGLCINYLEPKFRELFKHNLRVAGALMTILIVCSTFFLILTIQIALYGIHPLLGVAFNVFGMYTAFALRSLTNEGWRIRTMLIREEIELARECTSLIVSRNMSREGKQGIIRATIESLTENLSDGVIAPLFYAMIGGAPLALTYKAINTLDSMIGYRDEKYFYFGWFAARLDDVANFIPARITGALLVISSFVLRKNTLYAIKAWARDGQKGPSPNGGIPIVTFAGAMDIQLGGDCWGADVNLIHIPRVGGTRTHLSANDIFWANIFIYTSTAIMILVYLSFVFTSAH